MPSGLLILSGIPRAAQAVLGVYLKRTCSRVTSASSTLGVLNDYALYKSMHSLTQVLRLCCTAGVLDLYASGLARDIVAGAFHEAVVRQKQSRVHDDLTPRRRRPFRQASLQIQVSVDEKRSQKFLFNILKRDKQRLS